VFWMRSASGVSKREEKGLSLHTLFVLIPLHKTCEKSLLYPLVKKLPTGQMGDLAWKKRGLFTFPRKALNSHAVAFGSTGSGKSVTLARNAYGARRSRSRPNRSRKAGVKLIIKWVDC